MALVTLLAPCSMLQAYAQDRKLLALLPFENVSGSVSSLPIIMPLVQQTLRSKGYEIVAPEKLEPFLLRHRIRNTGMLSRAQLNNLRQEFGTDVALVGSVDLFHESEQNPQWGLSSRIASTVDGTILWAESAGLTGGDFTRVLGLGTIRSPTRLAEEVVKALFRSLPASGTPPAQPSPTSPGWRTMRSRYGYRNALLDSAGSWRVAVLLIENASERPGAGRILTDVLTTTLFQRGRFAVVDPGEPNDALAALGVAPHESFDLATLTELKKRAGIDALVLGTVYRYNEGLKREATTSPEVALDIRMIHAESGKIVWVASGEGTGDDYQIVLDFGVVRSMVSLLRRVLQGMLETL
ncbi:MAG: hypothetical protein HY695_02140 [Deltaproteobacteria bacterium]|nr:hypothetical protein [Deltaproteobacteria bacterium]